MKRFFQLLSIILAATLLSCNAVKNPRLTDNFNDGWKFHLGDTVNPQSPEFDDQSWRMLTLPHDWSIETAFDPKSKAGYGGGYLNGGIGWYRKTFILDKNIYHGKKISILFDGVYRNSEVWINGHYLGKRPNGYISFHYDLSDYLKLGRKNVIAVRVDNSDQPNSRWYSGSGIYRNVWLEAVSPVHFNHWGIAVTTPVVTPQKTIISTRFQITVPDIDTSKISIKAKLYDIDGKLVAQNSKIERLENAYKCTLELIAPHLWSTEDPYLYKLVSQLYVNKKLTDQVTTNVGVRYFNFEADKGFSLNGKPLKIVGVCNHHDLGCLGTAVNKRAIERQLEILKAMGCNGIRTSHNPPAPELLDLCDKMGFVVMDEAFDMWEKSKTTHDYSHDFKKWHERDLRDQILRDRNHPSVIIWSVGNEIPEQKSDSLNSGARIMKELCSIIRKLDTTRPIVTANNNPDRPNAIINSGATDLIGINYHIANWLKFKQDYPGMKLIITESTSALETRDWYQMPSDSILRVPKRWDISYSTPHHNCSAYDNCSSPWGSTHEETWKVVKANPYISGMFIWTGFDYIGEPTPYTWPARSSYFGIVDLAGFPKDVYYLYQSECTTTPVLHIFPHWNWKPGQIVDIWAYYNNADEVELFLNGRSLGKQHKVGDQLHVMWRVPFVAGTLKAVSYKNGKQVLVTEKKTAGRPAKIRLTADRDKIDNDGSDLSFISVEILDKEGNLVPDADNLVQFRLEGPGKIAGVDNGSPISRESFKADYRKAFNGKCLCVVQSKTKSGVIRLTATSAGLATAAVEIRSK
jgi:beta-galactosidase